MEELFSYIVKDGNNFRKIILKIDHSKPKVYREVDQYLFNTELISSHLITSPTL